MGLADRVGQLESRVAKLENQVGAVERTISEHLDQFSGYRSKTAEELADVRSQLTPIVNTLAAMVHAAESNADRERTARLLRRARNNLTRAENAALKVA